MEIKQQWSIAAGLFVSTQGHLIKALHGLNSHNMIISLDSGKMLLQNVQGDWLSFCYKQSETAKMTLHY